MGDVMLDDDDWGEEGGEDWGDINGGVAPSQEVTKVVKSFHRPYTFMDHQALHERRHELMEETKDMLYLTDDETDLLLRFLRYDMAKINAFLSSPEEQKKIRRESGLSGKKLAVPSRGEITCLVCLTKTPLAKSSALCCGHYLCNECWEGHIDSELNAGLVSIFTKCPGLDKDGKKCKEPIPFSMVKKFLKKDQVKKVEGWILDHFVDCMRTIKWCTKCSLAVEYTKGGSIDVQCKCGSSFCFGCGGEAHAPCPCDLRLQWNSLANDSEASSMRLIEMLTKPCPRCTTRIEKNRQCNHMKCTKCNFDFCWQCMQEIIIGDKHPSWYVCKITEEKVRKGQVDSGEAARTELNELLAKLGHHKQKTDACLTSRTALVTILQKIETFESKVPAESNCNWLLFLTRGVVEAFHFLGWSYVYSYYMKDSGKKTTFLNWQKIVEEKSLQISGELTRYTASEPEFRAFLKDGSAVSALKQSADVVTSKLEQMQTLADEISDALMTKADNKTDTWTCPRCDRSQSTTVAGKVASCCLDCRACRTHGDLDCLVVSCKSAQQR